MKKIIVSTLLSSLLLTNTIFAKSDTEPTSKEVSKNAIEIATKKAENNQVKLIQEALNSLEITAKALKNLEDNKKDEAKKYRVSIRKTRSNSNIQRCSKTTSN